MIVRILPLALLSGLGLLAGCAKPVDTTVAQGSSPSSEYADAVQQPALLEPLLFAAPPDQPLSVPEAKTKPAGEKVLVRGQLPPDSVKSTNLGVAAFEIMAPEDIARPEVQDEFACDEGISCPKCRKMLDDLGVRVELVDAKGQVIPSSILGFRKLGGGSQITIEGVVHREGKDGKQVRIVAQRFYPG